MQFSRERAIVLAAATTAFGLAAVLRKLAIDRVPPLRYQALSSIIYALTVPLFAMLATKYEKSTEPVDPVGLWWMVAATCVGLVGNLLFGYALRASDDVGMTTALSSTSPIVTLMFAFLFLHERPTFQAGLGCALVVAGVIVISLR
jgi:uncharacterized membrane protein